MEKICGIYQIYCKQNGKSYIGSSGNINQRWNAHRTNLRNGCHPNSLLQKDYNKYGIEQFEYNILKVLNNPKEAQAEEQDYILHTQKLYNIQHNGHQLHKSIETKNKLFGNSVKEYIMQKTDDFNLKDYIYMINPILLSNYINIPTYELLRLIGIGKINDNSFTFSYPNEIVQNIGLVIIENAMWINVFSNEGLLKLKKRR